MELSDIVTIFNIVAVVIVIYFTNRMLKASSVYDWNPGDSEIQDIQKIKALQSIVSIAFVGLIAAIINILFGLAP
ncbi:MAG: hypothetical protein A3C02_02085 [Candidatus Andersenbacteria bacterium RIFCSPHIGHO2_02_FULL_45_11]|uniref:Uncharacterized protein n=1 Tax=Candidatus Andersenbacteria bacterium RIFCSPHIGHO2_12_FULL_45_11 TaxID=1797281 RepID=A0A1G1X4G8_9BACT|nr:MAG: hypothetical protein A2805_03225 [Candidatus Andersenbacteria bacterium RIFCSPHIGHO2_01_FULL_46_36]OGY34882.1 MAG: hypothetical protein A3C02_02085 [Candidatus Andersenbacteria bacterium RIFCSPHIGHO2_02_FULL_45_11]OGY34915.1 MAG: hypothetical protein A3D99_03525 [Candidatus Andersenbacteria bacterium RIFCSPHIGHO2_12_FULL_45_11]